MARNKNSAALFEVIGRGKSLSSHSRPGMFAWLRGNSAPSAAPARVSLPDVAAAPATPAEGISLDSRRGQLCFQMSYTSAVIALFALATVVSAAFLAGQRFRPAHPALADDSTADIRQGPSNGNVVRIQGAPSDFEKMPPGQIKPTLVKNPPEIVIRGKNRQEGLNYVIIQGYPPQEEQMAVEAKKLLEENGIECTIEHKVPKYPPTWACVIGTWGFAHEFSASAEYKAYIHKINAISDTFTRSGKKKTFKSFAPAAMQWHPTKSGH